MPNTGETHHIDLDKTSVLLSTLGFGGLLYGFSSVGSYGWTSAHVYVPLLAGALITYFFIKRQSKLETPLLRFDAFKSQRFTIGLIIGMIINAALLFGGVLTPIYLQDIHGYSRTLVRTHHAASFAPRSRAQPVVAVSTTRSAHVRWVFSG